jgi:hypothetical protein
MAGRPLRANITPELIPSEAEGTQDVILVNRGSVDAPLPPQVELATAACEAADALPAYDLERGTGRVRFRLAQPRLLRAGERQVIGWIRCPGGADVRP